MNKDFSVQINMTGEITDKERKIIEAIINLRKENGFKVKVILEEVYDNELGEIELREEVAEEELEDTVTSDVLISASTIFYEID